MPPVTKALLISNLAIFLFDLFTRPGPVVPDFGAINTPLCFTIRSAFLEGKIWELITFQFLHATVGHIFFNSVGIYIFGPWAERWWGSRRFTAFYLLCGVAGALFFTLLTLLGILPGQWGLEVPLVGASAGIFGIMVCVTVIKPEAMVRLPFVSVVFTLRTFAFCFIGLAVAIILGDIFVGGSAFRNSGGEAGHLGGAMLGYLLTRYPFLLRQGTRTRSKIIRPKEFRRKSKPKLRPRSEIDVKPDSEVDRILDKIGKEGLQSITDEERRILHQAAQTHDEP